MKTSLAQFFFAIVTCFLVLAGLLGCYMESPPQTEGTVASMLVQLLQDPDSDIRRTAALTLGKMSHAGSLPALTLALKDHDARVREYSAWAIGQIGEDIPKESILALLTALGDPATEVKQEAALALWKIELPEAFLPLAKEILATSGAETRMAVVHALAGLTRPSAYPLFVEAVKDADPEVRQGAIAGLGELADPRALPLFRKHLLHDPGQGVRTEAAFRLGKFGGQDDIPSLQQAMELDPTPIVPLWAAWALKKVTPSSTP